MVNGDSSRVRISSVLATLLRRPERKSRRCTYGHGVLPPSHISRLRMIRRVAVFQNEILFVELAEKTTIAIGGGVEPNQGAQFVRCLGRGQTPKRTGRPGVWSNHGSNPDRALFT